MSTVSRIITAILLLFMLVASAAPLSFESPSYGRKVSIVEKEGLRVISNDVITVVFPSVKLMPRFAWYVENTSGPVYIVDFHGLIEYLVINRSYFVSGQHRIGEHGVKWVEERILELEEEANNTARVCETYNATCNALERLKELLDSIIEENITKSNAIEALENVVEDLEEGLQQCDNESIAYSLENIIQCVQNVIKALRNLPGEKFTHEVKQLARGLKQIIERNHAVREHFRDRASHMITIVQELWRKVSTARRALSMVNFSKHLPVVPFPALTWELSSIENITDNEGNVVGLTFKMNVTGAPEAFRHVVGRIELKFRIYVNAVEEAIQVNDSVLTYNVTPAEMKVDIVIKGWDWLLGILTETGIIEERIALDVRLAKLNITPPYISVDALSGDLPNAFSSADSHIQVTLKSPDWEDTTRLGFNETMEKHVKVVGIRRIRGRIKLNQTVVFMSTGNETLLAGFFKFIPTAIIVDPETGTSTVINVTASYAETLNHVRLFLCYPFFGNNTLMHDPSMGILIPEAQETPTTTITTTPSITATPSESVTPTTTPSASIATGETTPQEGVTWLSNIVVIGVVLTAIIGSIIALLLLKKGR